MAAFASGSASASARDADAGASAFESGRKEAEADCGHISASQMDLLARAHFHSGGGGGGAVEGEEEEAEVFSTPPLTPQDPQRQGQSQRGQAGEVEDGISMCSVPFTQTQPSPSRSSSPPSDSWELKPRKRICTRKVRGGAKVRTPTPTPTPTATPIPDPSPGPGPGSELDPLVRNVLMIPTGPLPTSGYKDILELARSRGIF